MQTHLSDTLLSTPEGREADAILRRCVHCGFCNATCPTYQLLGDELDGPRGRIYLIKGLLEGQPGAAVVRNHLDRCLTCRNCETTCPSGVEYGRLLDIGRERVERMAPRPGLQRLLRWGLRQMLPFPRRFALVLRLVSPFRGILPGVWRDALPAPVPPVPDWPPVRHTRRVILPDGCVQSVVAPEINVATARVLDRLGISVLRPQGSGCCGAVDQHLGAAEAAVAFIRRNIDAWWPLVEQGIEAIVMTASACGLQVKDYGHYLRFDTDYAEKARRIAALVRDVAEVVAAEPAPDVPLRGIRVAFHAPCTLQHGQRLRGGVVEGLLRRWGFEPVPVMDGHLCCGSAGTYSIMQPALSTRLQIDKLAALQAAAPDVITSANIGCLLQLRKGAEVPVRHWVELLVDCPSAE